MIWRWRKRGWRRYEGSQPGDRKGRPIGINRRKSPAPSVGARVVERRGVGLYGRPLSLSMLPDCVISPGDVADAGDHKGPPCAAPPPSPLRTVMGFFFG